MKGQYVDTVHDERHRLVFRTDWTSNAIVDSAWQLLCGLLVNRAGMSGISFLAVGAGADSWESGRPSGLERTIRLVNESARIVVGPEAVGFFDHNGLPVKGPTPWVEITVKGSWPDRTLQLREFGLVGGDATDKADSGLLINYVIHPLMILAPGNTLTRRIRLHLRPSVQRMLLEMSDGKLAREPIERIDGIAKQSAAALRKAGVDTIGKLARIDLPAQSMGFSPIKVAEWRARARLALAILCDLSAPLQLHGVGMDKFLVDGIVSISEQVGLSPETIAPLYEQVCRLQSCLDDSFLDKLTIGDLIGMQ